MTGPEVKDSRVGVGLGESRCGTVGEVKVWHGGGGQWWGRSRCGMVGEVKMWHGGGGQVVGPSLFV